MEELQELLTDTLRDLLDAEKQLTKALPRLAKAASNQELKQAFLEHTEVTKNQVTRLEQALEQLGQKAKGKPCKAMKGLVEEGQEHVQEHEKGIGLDCTLAASSLKVEHYEIASYTSARAMAKTMGQREVMALIQETLREEEQTGKLMQQIGDRLLKEAKESGSEEEEEDEGGEGGGGGRGRKAAGKQARKAGGKQEMRKSGGSSSPRGQSGAKKQGGGGNAGGGGRGAATATTDHEQIRQWAEERGAKPSCVRGTGGKGDTGMIRLDFPGYSGGDSLEEISWDEWFEKFDEQGLALLHQESTAAGQKSNFNKLVSRATAEASGSGSRSGRGGSRSGGGGKKAARGRR